MKYVMSDIHGNLQAFESIMEQINLHQDDKLYILGDVIDRHPYGIQILQKIMDMPNVEMLLGNHELMMLNALGITYKDEKLINKKAHIDHWYSNSGLVTHNAFQLLDKSKQGDIIDYLTSLPLNIDFSINSTNYKLCHAAPVELYNSNKNDSLVEFAVWDRNLIRSFPKMKDFQRIILGHTVTCCINKSSVKNGYIYPLIISNNDTVYYCIDTGAGYSDLKDMIGRLTCFRLGDNSAIFYSK